MIRLELQMSYSGPLNRRDQPNTYQIEISTLFVTYSLVHYSIALILLAITTNLPIKLVE